MFSRKYNSNFLAKQDQQPKKPSLQNSHTSFLFLNIQGLKNKILTLQSFLLNHNISAIGLTEHWLKADETSLASPDGFFCSSSFCRTDHIRGGSLVFTQNSLNVKICDVGQFCSEISLEAAAVFIDDLKVIFVSVYHSPSGNPSVFLENFDKLLSFISGYSNFTAIIGGDFNKNFDLTVNNNNLSKQFHNILRQYNFYFLNHAPTRGSNCLDNVLINCSKNADIACKVFDFPFSDHNGLLISLPLIRDRVNINQSVAQYLPASNIVLPKDSVRPLLDNIGTYDWACMFSTNLRAVDAFSVFFQVLKDNIFYFSKVINIKTKKLKSNANNRWYDSKLRDMKDRLIFLDKIIKNSPRVSQETKQAYNMLKAQYMQSIVIAKKEYNTSLIENSINKCKTAWQVIKTSSNCSTYSNISQISPDTFNKFFINSVDLIKNNVGSNVYKSIDFVNKTPIIPATFSWNLVTPNDLIKATNKLKNSNSNDVYLMSNCFLKQIIGNLAEPLSYCFNLCLLDGVFPDELKVSRVCPVFKKGKKDIPDSYRPISIIPVVSKLFEILVFDQLNSFFESNNFLSMSQFGFRKGKCTSDAIDKLVNEVLLVFERKSLAQATFCDLSRAFDCVDHDDLLMKLSFYGVKGSPLSFFKSYLSNRTQKVYIDREWSQELAIKYGVPQGSVLGPLLFLICINDLPDCISSKTYLYADDTTFLNSGIDLKQLQTLAQDSINTASTWFKTNGFLLNQDKTQQIIFGLRHCEADVAQGYVDQVKFLGLFLDKTLTWGPHIDYISSKLSRVIFLINRLTHSVDQNYIKTAYFAYFQSIFRYCIIFYGNCSRIEEILILQKKVIRLISNSPSLEHCRPLFIKLEIPTVINIYIYDLLAYVLKNPHLIKHKSHVYNTRHKSDASIEFYRLTKTANSYIIISLKIFNKLIGLISKYNVNTFKTKFYNWLLKNPFYNLNEFLNMSNIDF